ncbi:MAG: hypothetical protein PHU27_12805 [Salinivirgaceae bacterium]|nr:hypothetical protein [Salinivirgaceae bacterium]MDY0281034.1 hypothetical protein [Salinivirgaceae bacterium]
MKKFNKVLISLFVMSLFTFSAVGQINDNTVTEFTESGKFWFDIGIGNYYTTDSDYEGFSSNVSFNMLNKSLLYKIRYMIHDELVIFNVTPSEKYQEVGMLIGTGYSVKWFQCFVSGGIGLISGTQRGDILYTTPSDWFSLGGTNYYEMDKFITPSIPIELELTLKPIKYMGVGFSLYGNLNLKQSLYGFTIKLGIGKMR